MEEENVDDNHVENPSDLFFIADDEVKSRIEYKRLARNHSIPADGNESNRDIVIFPDLEELHEKCQCVYHDSPWGCQQAIKVKPATSLEGEPDDHVEIDNVIPRDGCKSAESHRKR